MERCQQTQLSQPTQRNWAGNVDYGVTVVHRPTSLEQLQELVAGARRVRVLGSRHSFNEIACSDDVLVSMDAMAARVEVDSHARTALVGGAVTYGHLTPVVHGAGLALGNLGSLPHISVAGACATGTHGSGDRNRVLAAAVRELELVGPDGELRTVRRGDDDFDGSVVALGALGAVTSLLLDLEPAFDVRQDVYQNIDLDPDGAGWSERDGLAVALSAAYSVSLFTDLRSSPFTLGWLKRRAEIGEEIPAAAPSWWGGTLSAVQQHPVPGQPAVGTTVQGVRGPWHEQLPHFRLDVPPSSRGAELQSEYLLPREHVDGAWRALMQVREQVASVLQIAEVRSVAADDLWLSPAQGRDVVAFHFTWHPRWPAVPQVLRAVEQQLEPFDARPHWGKLSVAEPARVRALFPRLPDVARLVDARDPQGRFRNRFVDAYLPRP